MKTPIKVVLSGSGLLYPIHAGAIARIREDYEIVEIAGISGGSIIGAMVASGYSDVEILHHVLATSPGDNLGLLDLSLTPWWSWGVIKGNKFLAQFRSLFPATFRETKIPLIVGTVNLDKRAEVLFSTQHTPDMDLPLAVRASMSFPFGFCPVKIDGDRYVDGGVAASFPLDIFGSGKDVIGVKISAKVPPGSRRIKNLLDYGFAMIDTMMSAADKEHIEDAVFARFIRVETSHSNANIFMKKEDAQKLYEEGYQNADTWIKKWEEADL